jgi:hypothetical protein
MAPEGWMIEIERARARARGFFMRKKVLPGF